MRLIFLIEKTTVNQVVKKSQIVVGAFIWACIIFPVLESISYHILETSASFLICSCFSLLLMLCPAMLHVYLVYLLSLLIPSVLCHFFWIAVKFELSFECLVN